MSTICLFTLCIYLSDTILNSTAAKCLVPGLFWVFWDLLLFLSAFSGILLGDVAALKIERFTESTEHDKFSKKLWNQNQFE